MLHRKSRRTFIKGLLGAAAAVGVPVAVKAAAEDAFDVKAADTATKRGYHETDHIRDYYNKVNF